MQEFLVRLLSQTSNPWLDTVFEAASMLAEQEVLVGIFALLYWNLGQRAGMVFGLTYLVSSLANQGLKALFASPRPYQVLPDIVGKRLETATGSSFPSGHAQGAASAYTTLALLVGRWWFWGAALLVIALVAVSRVYLGVHWPLDVTVGTLLGVAMAAVVWAISPWVWATRRRLASVLGGVATVLVAALAAAVVWDLAEVAKAAGVALGAVAGYLVQEFVHPFSTEGSRKKKAVRWVVGMTTTLGVLVGLKALFPHHAGADGVRYLAVGAWVTVIYPWVGTKIRLFLPRSRP